LVTNQIIVKTMTCQILGMANFGHKPIRPFVRTQQPSLYLECSVGVFFYPDGWIALVQEAGGYVDESERITDDG
jgi:hypothetical protein